MTTKKGKCRVLAVANQKGGVAKTTISINLGAALQKAGKRVLLVDVDPQHDLSRFLGLEAEPEKNLLSFIRGKGNMADLIQTAENGLHVVPGLLEMIELDKADDEKKQKEKIKFDLNGVKGDFDYIILDCSPYMSRANREAIKAADGVIVAATPDYGAAENVDEIAASARHYKKKICGIVVSRYDPRMVLNQTMIEELQDLAKKNKTKVYNTKIRESVAMRETHFLKKDIFSYSPRSGAAADYKALAAEIIKEG